MIYDKGYLLYLSRYSRFEKMLNEDVNYINLNINKSAELNTAKPR